LLLHSFKSYKAYGRFVRERIPYVGSFKSKPKKKNPQRLCSYPSESTGVFSFISRREGNSLPARPTEAS
jgi:hypothetical protein